MVKNRIPLHFCQQATRALRARGLSPSYYFPFLDADDDPSETASLEDLYLAGRSRRQRRQWGQYHTPLWLVNIILNWLQWPDGEGLLDPACGTGAFLVPAARRLADAGLARGLDAEATLRLVEGSLVGYDVDPLALFILSINLHCALSDLLVNTAVRPHWRLYHGDFLAKGTAPAGDFVIVGNPPWGATVPADIAGGYQETGESAFMFVEGALRSLAPQHPCAFVLPDTILLKHYPRIREMILTQTCIHNLAVLGRVFPHANVEAVALHLLGCRRPSPRHQVQIWRREGMQDLAALPPVEQGVFHGLPDQRFNIFMSTIGVHWTRRLHAGRVRLGQVYRVHEGIHSGNVRSKLFVPHHPGEKGRPLLQRGNELMPFQHRWEGWYVNYDPGLVQRDRGEYAGLGRPDHLGAPKVLVRRTGERLVAALDEEGLFISNNFFYCLPRTTSSLHPKVLVCLLNSTLMGLLYHLQNPVMGRMFAELKVMHLCAFAVPQGDCPRLEKVEPSLIALHDDIVKWGLSPSRRTELDEMVMCLYDCSAGEVAQLKEYLRQGKPR